MVSKNLTNTVSSVSKTDNVTIGKTSWVTKVVNYVISIFT